MARAAEYINGSCRIAIYDDFVEKDGARVRELLRAAAEIYIENSEAAGNADFETKRKVENTAGNGQDMS